MTLCTAADVEALLQVDIVNDLDPNLLTLIAMATEMIDTELGRTALGGVELVETIRHRPGIPRESILLNQWPVVAAGLVVVEDGVTLTVADDYDITPGSGIVTRLSSDVPITWATGAAIVVTYTPLTVPGTRTICAQAVARAIERGRAFATKPAQLGGIKQLTIGRWSATAETSTAATSSSALSLTDVERSALRAWRDRRP